MKKATIFGLFLLLAAGVGMILACQSTGASAEAEPVNFPFPQHAASTYAHPPTMPTSTSQAQMDALMINLFKKILLNNLIVDEHGPQDKDGFRMVNWHSLSWQVSQGDADYSHINVSESQGYGMMMMAYMAGSEKKLGLSKKDWIFGCTSLKDYYDAMLRTVQEYPSIIAPHLFAWQLHGYTDKGVKYSKFKKGWDSKHDGYTGFAINKGIKTAPFTRDSEDGDSATDGDMDIIYSLILADKQWGSNGRYNYLEIARTMLADLWQYCVHPTYKTLLLGDWASKGGDKGNPTLAAIQMKATRPSDFIISHLKVYKEIDSAHNWQEVIDATYNVMKDVYADVKTKHGASKGLLPDFVVRNAANTGWAVPEGFVLEDEHTDGTYAYNSCRIPWRLGTDYLLYGGNSTLAGFDLFAEAIQPIDKLATEMYKKEGLDIFGPLTLTGEGIWNTGDWDQYWNDPETFTAPFLITAAAADNKDMVNQMWKWNGLKDFWNDTWGDYIKMIVMLTASGNYWKP